MITRRDFIKTSIGGGAALMLPVAIREEAEASELVQPLHIVGPYSASNDGMCCDQYKTVLRIHESLIDWYHQFQVMQFAPGRTCRVRVMYRIPGEGNDYSLRNTLCYQDVWTPPWALGGRVSNATYYDIQVRCGPTFSGRWSGIVKLDH
jgi:hypothetical protein